MNLKKLPAILLVEDDEIDAEAVERSLSRYNVECRLVKAENGIEALDIMRGKIPEKQLPEPYVVFLDLNMPQMNGLDCLKHIRADKNLCDTIVFILTTSNDEHDKGIAFNSKIAGYFLKSEVGRDYKNFIEMTQKYLKLTQLPAATH